MERSKATMEVPQVQKQKQHQFTLASVSTVVSSSSSSAEPSTSPVVARFSSDFGFAELRFEPESEPKVATGYDVRTTQVRFLFLVFDLALYVLLCINFQFCV